MADLVRVNGARLPLGQRCYTVDVPAGQTVADIVRLLGDGRPAVVQVGGEPVPPEMWSKLTVKGGVEVSIAPEAGLETLLVALAAFVVGAAIVFLLPTPGSPEDVEQQNRLEGGGNRVTPYGPMPILFGRMRYAPPAVNRWIPYKGQRPNTTQPSRAHVPGYGAWQPVPQAQDDRQWVRTLLMWGLGTIDVTDIRLDQTPAADYGDGVRLVTSQTPNADFPTAVRKVDIGADLNGDATITRRIGRVESTCTVTLVWPQGLYRFNNSGEIHGFDEPNPIGKRPIPLTARLKTVAGVQLDEEVLSAVGGTTVTPFYQEVQLAVAAPQDCVLEIVRGQAARNSPKAHDDLKIDTAVIPLARAPVSVDATLTSVRIEATDQISGTAPAISGVGQARRPDWDGVAWTARATRNPAAAYRDVLIGSGNARPIAESRTFAARLQEWSEWCHVEGWTYDKVLLRQTSVEDQLKEIAAAGRASPVWIDGLRGVAIDRRQGARTQVFTPANSAAFSAKRATRPVPHALRCRFRDEDHDYARAEVRVYRPGFTSATATLVDERRMPGQTVRNTVAALLAYQLRAELARREEYTIETDWEHLVTEQGGRVGLLHDALHDRTWSGIALSVDPVGADAVRVRLDLGLELQAGVQYWGIVRPAVGRPETYVAGPTPDGREVLLRGSMAPVVSVGDLVAVGQVGTGVEDCILVGIDDAGDARARLSLIAYGGVEVFDAQPGYTVEHTNPGGMVSEVPFGAREIGRLATPITTTQTIYIGQIVKPARPAGEAIPAGWSALIPNARVVWVVSRMIDVFPRVASPAPATYELAGITIPIGSEVDYGPWSEIRLAPWVGLKELALYLVDKTAQSMFLAVTAPPQAPDRYRFDVFVFGQAAVLHTKTVNGDATGAAAAFTGLCPGFRYRCRARAIYNGEADGPYDYLLVGLAGTGVSVFTVGTDEVRAATQPVEGGAGSYEWEYDIGQGNVFVWVDAGTTQVPEQTIDSLPANSQINVRVRIVEGGMEGEWSEPGVGFTRQQSQAPEPTGGVALAVAAGTFIPTVSWVAPDSDFAIHRFGVRIWRGGEIVQSVSVIDATETEWAGEALDLKGQYFADVRAVSRDDSNNDLFGDWVQSDPLDVSIPPATDFSLPYDNIRPPIPDDDGGYAFRRWDQAMSYSNPTWEQIRDLTNAPPDPNPGIGIGTTVSFYVSDADGVDQTENHRRVGRASIFVYVVRNGQWAAWKVLRARLSINGERCTVELGARIDFEESRSKAPPGDRRVLLGFTETVPREPPATDFALPYDNIRPPLPDDDGGYAFRRWDQAMSYSDPTWEQIRDLTDAPPDPNPGIGIGTTVSFYVSDADGVDQSARHATLGSYSFFVYYVQAGQWIAWNVLTVELSGNNLRCNVELGARIDFEESRSKAPPGDRRVLLGFTETVPREPPATDFALPYDNIRPPIPDDDGGYAFRRWDQAMSYSDPTWEQIRDLTNAPPDPNPGIGIGTTVSFYVSDADGVDQTENHRRVGPGSLFVYYVQAGQWIAWNVLTVELSGNNLRCNVELGARIDFEESRSKAPPGDRRVSLRFTTS